MALRKFLKPIVAKFRGRMYETAAEGRRFPSNPGHATLMKGLLLSSFIQRDLTGV